MFQTLLVYYNIVMELRNFTIGHDVMILNNVSLFVIMNKCNYLPICYMYGNI